ncbi:MULTISPECIES: tetratricopeptide repeat protein [Sorangium]|uniref:tetratricopeptide repeat protein n=1 Tax=Sorangium TaxID=39643 RepID=UPI003D9C63B9
MERRELDGLTREELIARAEGLGVPRPRVLTKAELVDEILARAAQSEPERARLRGFLGRARDLLSRVVERGLHMPETARALRGEPPPEQWPPPAPTPLPTTTLAEIYASQGHTARAIAVLDEILARAPQHEEARQLRARLIEKAQREQEEGTGAAGAKDEEETDEEEADEEGADEEEADEDVGAEEIAEAAEEIADAEAAGAEATKGAAPEAADVAGAEAPGPVALVEAPAADGHAGEPEAVSEAPAVAPVPSPRDLPPAEAPAQASPVAEDSRAGAALSLAAIVQDERAEMPARYDVDEIVGLAVDPETLYLYWEVRPRTLARARVRRSDGQLVIRVVAVLPSWERPVVEQRDLAIDALFGDMFVRDIPAGAHLRMCTGWLAGDVFEPFAVGLEVAAPRALPVAPRPSPAEPVASGPAALLDEIPPGSLIAPSDPEPHVEGAAGDVYSPASGALDVVTVSEEPSGVSGGGGTPAAVAGAAPHAAPAIAPAPPSSAPAASGGGVAAEAAASVARGDVVTEAAAPAWGRDAAPQAATPAASRDEAAAVPSASPGASAEAVAFVAGDARTEAAASASPHGAAPETAAWAPLQGPAVDVGTTGHGAPGAAGTGRLSPSAEPPRFPSGTAPTPEAIAHAVAATRGGASEGPPRFPSGTVPTPEAIAHAVAATRGGASELGRRGGGGAGPGLGPGGPPHASEALRRIGAEGARSLGGGSELRGVGGGSELRGVGGGSELRGVGGGSELRSGAGWARPLGGGTELWRSFATGARAPSGGR